PDHPRSTPFPYPTLFRSLEQDPIIGIVRDRAAGSQRDQPRAAPAADAMVHRVVMNQGGAATAFRAESFRQHPEHVIKLLLRQMADRKSTRLNSSHQIISY